MDNEQLVKIGLIAGAAGVVVWWLNAKGSSARGYSNGQGQQLMPLPWQTPAFFDSFALANPGYTVPNWYKGHVGNNPYSGLPVVGKDGQPWFPTGAGSWVSGNPNLGQSVKPGGTVYDPSSGYLPGYAPGDNAGSYL